MSFLPGLIEDIKEGSNPKYLQNKQQRIATLEDFKLKATIILVASAAFAVLGISLTVAGGFSVLIGMPVTLISLPLCYLTYNSQAVLANLSLFYENPSAYRKDLGLGEIIDISSEFDTQKLKTLLAKDTFCFGAFIDKIVADMMKRQK